MEPRLNAFQAAPGVYRAMLGVEAQVNNHSGLDVTLLNLVRMRASQINRCGYCLDMHWKDARAQGETEQRLYCLEAWREAPFYTDRERAALAWTEAVTMLTDGFVPDAVFQDVRPYFTDEQLAHLTLAIVAINGWNRLNVAFRTVPGTYQVPEPAAKAASTK